MSKNRREYVDETAKGVTDQSMPLQNSYVDTPVSYVTLFGVISFKRR